MAPRFNRSEAVKVDENVTQYKIAIVSDLDKHAIETDEDGDTVWKGIIMKGTFTYDCKEKKAKIAMDGKDEAMTIRTSFSRGGRGMELSELIIYNGSLYTVCDKTGIVYDVSEGKAVPWVILATGNGNQTKGFKGEWMTVKNDLLYVGSHGAVFVNSVGTILHDNNQWIKTIDKQGAVKHINWTEQFNAMKSAIGYPLEGYFTHEAGVWSDVHKQWFFLPRKASREFFVEELDERRCTNMLIRCDECFKDIKVTTIGEVVPTHGFSTFKFVPNTMDTVIVALKSEELSGRQKSFIMVFTIDGEIIMEETHLADAKYEGLEFI